MSGWLWFWQIATEKVLGKKSHIHTFFMKCSVLYITAANLPSEVCSFLMTPEIRGTGWSSTDM